MDDTVTITLTRRQAKIAYEVLMEEYFDLEYENEHSETPNERFAVLDEVTDILSAAF